MDEPLAVFIVSDATGGTAERMVRAALVQFPSGSVRLVRRAQIRLPEQIETIVREAAGQRAIIIHTLVSSELRQLILVEARRFDLEAIDAIGPLLDRLSRRLGLPPGEQPGLLEQLQDARTREIEAVSFAFRHDDGQNVDDLDQAEIVVVGVSRTMKTPTMLYLAYRGWFAANVPLVPGLPLQAALEAVPSERVFCLRTTPEMLQRLRLSRAVKEGIPVEHYASPAQVRRELAYSGEACRTHHWRQVDVTGKSVEEVAREIIVLASEGRDPRP